MVTRAKTLKLRHEGKTIESIAEALEVHKNTVILTLSKFEKQGLSYALYDAPGRGRNTKNNRFEFVYTPKHGSWLNLIESFFSKMTKQMLRGMNTSGIQRRVEEPHIQIL